MAEQYLGETAAQTLEEGWLRQFQIDHRAWRVRNFGIPVPHQPVLGVIEELCELYEAQLQRELYEAQLQREEMGDKELTESELDAVGDILVYAADLCGSRSWDLASLWPKAPVPMLLSRDRWVQSIRAMAHHQLKGEQNIRGGTAHHEDLLKKKLSALFECLAQYVLATAASSDVTSLSILQQVWLQVKRRDWLNNPDNAHEVANGSQPSST